MKLRELSFVLAFVLVLFVAIGSSMIQKNMLASSDEQLDQNAQSVVFPQLSSEGRAEASTMVVEGSPPMQPENHIDRWNPELRQESCLACHASPQTGAPTPPKNHWIDGEQKKGIFRDNCIQCHSTNNDSKPAFNSEN